MKKVTLAIFLLFNLGNIFASNKVPGCMAYISVREKIQIFQKYNIKFENYGPYMLMQPGLDLKHDSLKEYKRLELALYALDSSLDAQLILENPETRPSSKLINMAVISRWFLANARFFRAYSFVSKSGRSNVGMPSALLMPTNLTNSSINKKTQALVEELFLKTPTEACAYIRKSTALAKFSIRADEALDEAYFTAFREYIYMLERISESSIEAYVKSE